MEYIQLMTIAILVTICQATTSCTDNQVYHSNGICCQYVRCEPQHFVKVCENNGGADVCYPCPDTAYLDDSTDSNFVFDCVEKNCGEDTVPSDYPATKFDSKACSKRCRCNTAKHFCGTDPCRCQHHLCVHPDEVLQENCTCVRKETGNNKIYLITPSTKLSTSEPEAATRSPATDVTINPILDSTSSKTQNVANDTRYKEEEEILNPKLDDSPTERKEPTTSSSLVPWLIILPIIIIFCFTIIVLAVAYVRRRRKSVIYRNIYNHHSVVHNYEHCNVQVGNKNKLTVCNMGENDDDRESTE